LVVLFSSLAAGGCNSNSAERQADSITSRPSTAVAVVPDLIGVSEDQARRVTTAKNLRPRVTTMYHPGVAAGRVAGQTPAPGTVASEGAPVIVYVSLGSDPALAAPTAVAAADTPAPATPTPPLPADGSETTPVATAVAGPTDSSTTMPTARAPTPGAFLVCIDPGHPSETSAGANAHGLSENRLNWQVAQRLARRLDALGIAYQLTKTREGEYVTNRQRAEIANRAGAALFLRLHCDVGGGRGYAWFYPDRAGTKQGVTGPPPAVQRASREAAHVLNEAMRPILKGYLQSNPIKTDAATFVGGKQGGVLTGSIFARVPTALIEMCFINQKNDARFIASEAGQDKMAEAIAAGVAAYRDASHPSVPAP